MIDSFQRSAAFWDSEVVSPTHTSWMGHPVVRDYINRLIGGSYGGLWPLDWFECQYPNMRFERALSVGCGIGLLERDLIRRDLCGHLDAFDGSVTSLHVARCEAIREGMSHRIRYFASDFNAPSLPRSRYNAVFFHQSLHHVAKLEKILRAVLLSLKPNGLLYLDEYVGPSRSDWNDEAIASLRKIFLGLPNDVKTTVELALPIQADDPSEAIRSSEILEQVAIGFRVLDQRQYGGNVLSVLYPAINWNMAGANILDLLLREEQAVLASGARTFYTIVVARARRFPFSLIASCRYFLEPKMKRLGREISARLR